MHTPLPWFTKWETNIFSGRRLVANTGGYQNNIIDETPQNISNAEFIIRACNSHADLLEALETAYKAISSLEINAFGSANDGEIQWPIRDELLDRLAKAIAKAKGE